MVAPTGQLGKAAVNLKNLLAESSTFQTAVGAGDAAAAKALIFIGEYFPDPGDGITRPFALISRNDDRSESIGSSGFGFSGILVLSFEREISAQYQDDDQADNAEIEFLNFIDSCVEDCQGLSNQPGYLLTRDWDVGDLFRIDGEHIFGIKINVAWGLVTS